MFDRLHKFVSFVGSSLVLMATSLMYVPKVFFRWKETVRQSWIIGVESLALACFFLFLIGMVSALQSGIAMRMFGQEERIGWLLGAVMVREMGPLMTAFVLVARCGSSMAAEIGTMKVSEEISALRIMSISPYDYIVMPRMVAFTFMAPLVTVFATLTGILGGMVVAHVQFHVPLYVYLDQLMEGIKPPLGLYWSLLRSVVFGLTAVTIACTFGLNTSGGALGVGRASRNTVVYSLVLIVFLNFILTSFYLVLEKVMEALP